MSGEQYFSWRLMFCVVFVLGYAQPQFRSFIGRDIQQPVQLPSSIGQFGITPVNISDECHQQKQNSSTDLLKSASLVAYNPQCNLIWYYFPEMFKNYTEYLYNQRGHGIEFMQSHATDGCLNSVVEQGQDDFSAVGQIRIVLNDGEERYCVGSILSKWRVVTVWQCGFEDNITVQFQPRIYIDTDIWFNVSEISHLEEATNRTHNYVILTLQQELETFPQVKLEHSPDKPLSNCYLTMQGWSSDEADNGYYLTSCPNLPNIVFFEDKNTSTCGSELCDISVLYDGSPIYLTCELALGQIDQFLIGMKFASDKLENDAILFGVDVYWELWAIQNQGP
eukprot:TRINITY_DN224_c1_g3_i1.p1 TRINITY_DN224_c1_g3~~TRINITY_DN224_c1_g3_i1.p1  ORF type:complete len:336 (-),score=14.32 TRINITY_DN224_c1_g3_i1:541-1548(-)